MRLATLAACLLLVGLAGERAGALGPERRELPSPPPTSLRRIPLDTMLAWMGVAVGEWMEEADRPRGGIPPGLRELPSREAALILMQANLAKWESAAFELYLDAPAGAAPPERGWLLLEVFRRRYLDFEVVTWIRFGAGSVELHRLAEMEDRSIWHSCMLSAGEARWLAETVWWLWQVRARKRGEDSGIYSSFGGHHPQARLTMVGVDGMRSRLAGAGEENLGNYSIGIPHPKAVVLSVIATLIEDCARLPSVWESITPPVEFSHRRQSLLAELDATLPAEMLSLLAPGAGPDELALLRQRGAESAAVWAPSPDAEAKLEAALTKQGRRSDPAELARGAVSDDEDKRTEAIADLAQVDPALAASVIERTLRRPGAPSFRDWHATEQLPASVRRALLERLVSDRSLSAARRASAEYWLLARAKNEDRDDARLAAYLARRSHPAKLRRELCRTFQFRDHTLPSAGLQDVLHRIANDRREDRFLRATAAFTLGAVGDRRAVPGLLRSLGKFGAGDTDHHSRAQVLAALVDGATSAERQRIVLSLRGPMLRRTVDFSDSAWLGNLRELERWIQPLRQDRDIASSRMDGNTVVSSARARAVLLAWNEPDRLTRAQLGLVRCLDFHPAYRIELAALRRRMAEFLQGMSPAELTELAAFVQQLEARRREANLSTNDEVRTLVAEALRGPG